MCLPYDIGPIDWAEEDTGPKPVVRNARRMALPGALGDGPRFHPSFTRQRKLSKGRRRSSAQAIKQEAPIHRFAVTHRKSPIYAPPLFVEA